MLDKFINLVARRPALLDFLRRLLENGHQGQRSVIGLELPNRLSQRVLDLGCGTGVFSPFFGPDYVGIDISKIYIDYARRRFAKTFYVMDAQKLNFPDGSFDIIWINGVLHHLDDEAVRTILGEMRRVLKTGGQAVVMEDAPPKKIISRIIRSLDVGENIRPAERYRRLFEKYFVVQKEYPLRTGVCDYQVFILS